MPWIYCTDRMPPEPTLGTCYDFFDRYVLVTTKSGEVMRGAPGYYIETDGHGNDQHVVFKGWVSDGECWDIEVKAWMPLPEPAP